MAANQEPQVKGITRADYQQWRHHPTSKVVLQFLQDFHRILQREAWAVLETDPRLPLNVELLREMSGRAKAIEEVYNLPFESIVSFYSNEEENGTQATQA